ncbi:MAG: M15 family metallopeptidase, partial [Cellulomonadaceae bacterium]|nr:M15 family metallopeptidase [Cellulomonadaceae bacterium]
MEADNTSAFNCRAITGGTAWSEHAYGRAIDLNPVENPYVVGDHVAPEAGRAYVDRPELPGVIHDGDVVVTAFAAAGWTWGGTWSSPVDYQHFSVTGR